MSPYRTEVKEVHETLGAGARCHCINGGGDRLTAFVRKTSGEHPYRDIKTNR